MAMVRHGVGRHFAAALVAALVHELLAFSKSVLSRRDAPLETVPLAELVREALEREAGEARIEMLVADDLGVMAVPQLLKRAIENVIRNAVRYAAADGPIRISAGRAGRPCASASSRSAAAGSSCSG